MKNTENDDELVRTTRLFDGDQPIRSSGSCLVLCISTIQSSWRYIFLYEEETRLLIDFERKFNLIDSTQHSTRKLCKSLRISNVFVSVESKCLPSNS